MENLNNITFAVSLKAPIENKNKKFGRKNIKHSLFVIKYLS